MEQVIKLNRNDLVEGEVYMYVWTGWHSKIREYVILRFGSNDRMTCIIETRHPKDRMLVQDIRYRTSGNYSFQGEHVDELRVANFKERKWLEACEEAGMLVYLEDVPEEVVEYDIY